MIKQYKKYKESGIEWIGEIPNKWNIVKLKFLADTKFSSVDRHELEEEIQVAICHYPQAYKNEKINTETSLSLGTCSQSEVDNFSLKKGQVIITKDSETADDIGIPTYVEEDIPNSVCGYHLAILQSAHKQFNTEFLFRYLQSNHVNYYFENNSNGVTRFGLGKPTIENLAVPLPSIEEQCQIAFYLNNQTSIIDQLINKKQKLIELLKERRQAIISEAVTKGLNPHIKMKDSGIEWLGLIPEGWKVLKLNYIVEMKSGNFISAENIEDEDLYPIYGGNGIRGYYSEYTHEGFYPLIGRQGALCGNINYANGKFWATEHAVVVSPKKQIDTIWIGELLRLMNLNQYSQASAQPGLSVEKISNLRVPFPSYEEQTEIAYQLKLVNDRFDFLNNKLKDNIEKLKEFRKSIISEAVTGKIDVREWQPNTQNNLAYT